MSLPARASGDQPPTPPHGPSRRSAGAHILKRAIPCLAAFVLGSKGRSREQAEDITQGFFRGILAGNDVQKADPRQGRFRTFLLTAFQRFMYNEWNRAHALKRGGVAPHVSLDFDRVEDNWSEVPTAGATPEQIYDRQWALQLLERAFHMLRNGYRQSGKETLFDSLKACVVGEPLADTYAAVGESLGLSEDAVKTAVYRLRKRHRVLLRDVVEQTLADPEQVDEELRHLVHALAG